MFASLDDQQDERYEVPAEKKGVLLILCVHSLSAEELRQLGVFLAHGARRAETAWDRWWTAIADCAARRTCS